MPASWSVSWRRGSRGPRGGRPPPRSRVGRSLPRSALEARGLAVWAFMVSRGLLMTPSSAALGGRGFVQDEPVDAQLLDGGHELGEVHRLADVAVGAVLVAGYEGPFPPR